MDDTDTVTIDSLCLVHEDGRAWLMKHADDVDQDGFWVPKSLIDLTNIEEQGQTGFVVIPEWKAEELDLI